MADNEVISKLLQARRLDFAGITDSPRCKGCLSVDEAAPHVILECVGVAKQGGEILVTLGSLREACGDTRRILRFWTELGGLYPLIAQTPHPMARLSRAKCGKRSP